MLGRALPKPLVCLPLLLRHTLLANGLEGAGSPHQSHMMRKLGEKGAINAFAITDLESAFTFLFPSTFVWAETHRN